MARKVGVAVVGFGWMGRVRSAEALEALIASAEQGTWVSLT